MVRTYTDITKRRVSSDLVNYFARHDALTKLVNRRVFEERLVAAIEASRGTGGNVALLYMDLDRFKAVNDTRGHSVGDRLLMEAAARMCSAVRNTDTVARMGGDEFAILQPLIPDVTAAEVLAQRLIQVVSKPYKIDGIPCLVGLSIGIAIFPKDSDDVGLLLRHADTALYRTKSDCRGTYLMFEDSMEGRQRELFEMEGDLRDAFQLNQLEIFYQPIVNSKTRKIVAFEALLRWQHKSGRDVSPHEFVPIAEMSGLIIPIGLWVLENACVEAASWHNELSIAVNLSPVQFRHGDLITQIKGVLERTGLPAQRLTLEITEGILLEGTQEVLTTMGRLQQLGVRFSLDDFGTEHAGLSYLCSFPFHSIKIDKSIVQHALIRKSAGAIVAAIIAMCKALDLTVIGEGVETEEQLALLCGLGCTQVQGFLTGSPRPGRENRDFL
jgi:diguanylate cyclase (GGDEF)-like protein